MRKFTRLFKVLKKRTKVKKPVSKHYLAHKEQARISIHARLKYFAPLCGVVYKRVSVRNQRRRWGSCTSLGNLNFNYKLIFLPSHLSDYVIVHELCHLKQMNHGPEFWAEVAKILPNYDELVEELRHIEKHGLSQLIKSNLNQDLLPVTA